MIAKSGGSLGDTPFSDNPPESQAKTEPFLAFTFDQNTLEAIALAESGQEHTLSTAQVYHLAWKYGGKSWEIPAVRKAFDMVLGKSSTRPTNHVLMTSMGNCCEELV